MTYCYDEKPSPIDERDWCWESIVRGDTKLPSELDLRNYCQPVRNQGSRGTCAAFTASAIKEYHEAVEYTKKHKKKWKCFMSPNSVYFYRSTKPGAGMFGRNVMKILKVKGICTEYYFPYNGRKEPKSVPKQALDEMFHFKIANYARISTIDGAKNALFNNGPLYISFPVYKNSSNQFWKPEKRGDKSVGGHAVTVVGWTKEGFIIRNSWGQWNGDGHIIYPFSDWGSHWEIWTSFDDETDYVPPHINIKKDKKKCCNLL